MRIWLLLRASIVALALVGWAATPALAAPQMLDSDPEAGAELHEPPSRVSITFSEPLTGESDIKVTDDCGDVVSVGDAEVRGTTRNELTVAIGNAPHHGTYVVQWYATGVTGTGSGKFTFTVHAGSGCGGGGGGGGHDGHDGDGSGDGSAGGGHGGHGGGDDGGGSGGGGHSGGHGGGSTGGDHSGMDDHSGMSDHSMDHSGSGRHDMSGKHKGGRGGHGGKHGRHGKNRHGNDHGGQHDNGDDVRAAGPTGPGSEVPTGTTVVIALGLAVLMGVAGGWVLRISTPR